MGIWTRVLHGSCSYISELDLKLLNHPIWISTAQVMVHFIIRTTTAKLFKCLCPDFRTEFSETKGLNLGLFSRPVKSMIKAFEWLVC